jgi:hypothetical protein
VKYPIGTAVRDIEMPDDIGFVCEPASTTNKGPDVVWARWKSRGYASAVWEWASSIEPHPDPDAAWADYCAAVLRGDVS